MSLRKKIVKKPLPNIPVKTKLTIFIAPDDMKYIIAEMKTTELPASFIARELISEAVRARKNT